MKRIPLAASLVAALALLLSPAGCGGPKAGGSCSEGSKATCADPTTLLECQGGTWEAQGCLGPKGCSGAEGAARCDTSLAREGDACGTEASYSCTTDKKAQLQCKTGKWTVTEKCLGDRGCDASGMFARCDSSLANEGDACETNEKDPKQKRYACSVDRKAELLCKGGQWKAIEQCTGARGCQSGGIMVSCDGPVAREGAFCDRGEKEDYACSPDGKAQLRCENDQWKLARRCLGQKGCSSSGMFIECDASVVDPGEACDKDGNAACSTDGKTILECRKGKFEKTKVCPKACKASSLFVSCD